MRGLTFVCREVHGSFVRKRGSTWTAYYYLHADGRRVQHSLGGFATKTGAREVPGRDAHRLAHRTTRGQPPHPAGLPRDDLVPDPRAHRATIHRR